MIDPLSTVGVRSNRIFRAANIPFRLGMFFFNPLEHLNIASEFKSVDRYREIIVFKRFFRFSVACHVNWLAFKVLIDFVAFGKVKFGLRLFERFSLFDRSAFVPEQKRERDNKQNKTNDNAFKRLANSLKPGCVRCFSKRICHFDCSLRLNEE